MSRIYVNKFMKCVLVTWHEQGIWKPVKSVTAILVGTVVAPTVSNYFK